MNFIEHMHHYPTFTGPCIGATPLKLKLAMGFGWLANGKQRLTKFIFGNIELPLDFFEINVEKISNFR